VNYALFIDDERDPPLDNRNWIIARSVDEAKEIVSDIGWPDYISFDHDLGENQETGKDFANFMVESHMNGVDVFNENFQYYVHSQNPTGAQNIRGLLDSFIQHINS
jgi:hypothetical protein